MANFPLATWQVTAPPFFIQRGTSTPVDVDGAVLWGFGVSDATTGTAITSSIAGYLANALDTSGLGIDATASYNYVGGTAPSNSPLTYTIIYDQIGGFDFTVYFDTDEDAAVYGFASSTVVFPNLLSSKTTTYNPAGVWVPCGVAGDVRRVTRQRAAASSSEMSGLSTDVVNWGAVADIELLSSVFPAGNLTRWFAATDVYANAAGRQVADPNNTLEGLLFAAATGVTFRIYRQPATAAGILPTTYLEARMPTISANGSAEDYSSAVDEPRLWSTAGLLFRGNI